MIKVFLTEGKLNWKRVIASAIILLGGVLELSHNIWPNIVPVVRLCTETDESDTSEEDRNNIQELDAGAS